MPSGYGVMISQFLEFSHINCTWQVLLEGGKRSWFIATNHFWNQKQIQVDIVANGGFRSRNIHEKHKKMKKKKGKWEQKAKDNMKCYWESALAWKNYPFKPLSLQKKVSWCASLWHSYRIVRRPGISQKDEDPLFCRSGSLKTHLLQRDILRWSGCFKDRKGDWAET